MTPLENELLEALRELESAGSKVKAGLEQRIDNAAEEGSFQVPVFAGIADLHDALHRARAIIARATRSAG